MSTWMRSTFFVYFFSWTIFISYWSLYLDARGFAAPVIGLSITIGLITRALAVALLFPLANMRIPLGLLVRILSWLGLITGALFIFDLSDTGLYILSAFFGLTYPTLMPAMESLATLGAQRKLLIYGPTRLYGSFGFMMGAVGAGIVAHFWSNSALIYLFLTVMALAVALLHTNMGSDEVYQQKSASLGNWAALLKRSDVVTAIALALLIQASHAAYYAFGAYHLNKLGASPILIAFAIMLTPTVEMAVFQILGKRIDQLSISKLYAFSGLAVFIRWGIWALTDNLLLLTLSQMMHGLTFGVLHLAFTQVLKSRVRPDLVSPAQSLYQALGLGVGSAVMTAIAGALIDTRPFWAFFSMALLGAAVVVGSPLLARELKKHPERMA